MKGAIVAMKTVEQEVEKQNDDPNAQLSANQNRKNAGENKSPKDNQYHAKSDFHGLEKIERFNQFFG